VSTESLNLEKRKSSAHVCVVGNFCISYRTSSGVRISSIWRGWKVCELYESHIAVLTMIASVDSTSTRSRDFIFIPVLVARS